MEHSLENGDFKTAYKKFVAAAANHMTPPPHDFFGQAECRLITITVQYTSAPFRIIKRAILKLT